MFKLKFAETYYNSIYYKVNRKPITEDCFKVNENIFCVADGITRDLKNGNFTPYPETIEELDLIESEYPNPSGAFKAATITCDKFVEYISYNDENKVNEEMLLDILKKVNSYIWEINRNREINYIDQDLYATEAVGGLIVDDFLYCFSVGDCHITLLDDNLKIVFDTPTNTNFSDYVNPLFDKFNFNWSNPECRYLIRRLFRNNPSLKDNGQDISFGALTGEENSIYYINTYKVDLTNVKYICAYSDGYEPNFESREEIEKLIYNPESSKDSGKERTLILYEFV